MLQRLFGRSKGEKESQPPQELVMGWKDRELQRALMYSSLFQVTAELTRICHPSGGNPQEVLDTFTHKQWKKVRERAGLPALRFHDLRKTFGSILAQKGIGVSVVQNLLEHADPRTTHEIYTDVDPVYRQAVALIPVEDLTGL